ncbi:MAG: TonB-dependent receptor [Prevotella sp.]|nr:TonB-dependent receptor [Prevotella sp.]MBQ6209377.1 TonB-dependent receptor [Prevotella sp.]
MNQDRLNPKHSFAKCKRMAFLFLMLLPMTMLAQTVTGIVTDAKTGEEIIGASVKVKGASTGAVTNVMGEYTITAVPDQTLEFSYIGFVTQTVKVGNQQRIDIKLVEEENALNEVVVVGYGVMKRSDLTGAVSSIDEKAIKQGVNTNIEQAMQGRIAGVQVTQNSGAPGGGISVQIRGINSLNGNEPLYVIDGIAVSGQTDGNSSALSTLNPADITSLEVLKDASATAIYGSRASNGVVLITTKRGQKGKPKLSYEGYVGWQQLPSELDVMNLAQYAEYHTIRAKLMGWGESYEYRDPSLFTEGTNWQDVLFRTAFMHNHQVGISGGTDEMHYALSGGYLDQDGIAIGSGFTRVSVRANFDTNITKWLQVGMNGYFANTDQTVTFEESGAIQTALNQYPDVAPYNPDGTLGFGETHDYQYQSNPLFEASMKDNWRKNNQLDYNFFANVTPLKGLTLRVEYGGSRSWGNSLYFTPQYEYGNVRVESELSKGNSRNTYTSFKQYATYDFDPVKDHHFQIMAGHESQEGEWYQLSAARNGYISSSIKSLAVGDASTATNGEQGADWAIESYYGRLNYNLLNRYLLTATLRADGSSNFDKGHKWGYFPSAAIAWRISQEKFMQNIKWLDNMKIRLGWGHVGNQNTAGYAYGIAMKNATTAWGTGYYPGNFSNSELKWESTKAWNAGIDFNVLNGRIEFIVDAYLKNTDNLLLESALPQYLVPAQSWNGISAPWVNTGSIRNKGLEFTLNTVNISKKDLLWRTGITLSINRNKVTKLNSESAMLPGTMSDGQTYTMSTVGGAVGRFYGYNVIGMFTCEDDFYQKNQLGEFMLDANGNRLPVARPADGNGNMYDIAPSSIWVGDYIFEDVNGDGIIDEKDRKYIGNPNPDFTFGINNVITWKDFELSFFFNGSVGNDVYNYVRQRHTDPMGWGNKMAEVSQYAHVDMIDPNGSLTDISNVYVSNASTAQVQRITANGQNMNDNNRPSSRFVENGSYLRLKTLSLAYNLPKKWLAPVKIEWVQVYANVQNLFTICGYKGYDPELGAINQNVKLQGLDNYRYPSQRIFNFGIKVNL